MGSEVLKKQLEFVRFERAIDYINGNAMGLKHLNTTELAHINNLLTHTQGDPWRKEPTDLKLPTGQHMRIAIVSNPMIAARDLISNAMTKAGNGDVDAAATDLYTGLVINHFFKDANRRTAVAATYWLLLQHGIQIAALGLLELGLGDIRADDQVQALQSLLKVTINIARNRAQKN